MGNEKMCLRNRFSKFYSRKKKSTTYQSTKLFLNHSITSSEVVEIYLLTFIIFKNMINFYIYL